MFTLTRIPAIRKIIKYLPKIPPSQFHTNNALFKNQNDRLKVKIQGEELQFPYVWLRDNCQCAACLHSTAKSRILDWSYFDADIEPRDVTEQEQRVTITWPDGHQSSYNHNWLKFRSFSPQNQKKYVDTIFKPKKLEWSGADFSNICSKHNYTQILQSDEALYNWLNKLSIYGVTLIENTPDSETALDAIVNKIGFTKRTHYGEKFVVQSVSNTSNVAYLPNKLQMHTDLSYYEYCPGVNMLHCVVQTETQGGENLLCDSHFVAQYMKEQHPQEYKLLTEVEVEWSDFGTEDGLEFFKLHRSPVIVLNKHGEITRISFSVSQRGSNFPGPIGDVVPWYKAYSLFLELSHKFAAQFKNQAGNILVFDNIRILHGRSAYEDRGDNVRKLIGGYIDWDEIYSRLRCLKIKLNNDEGLLFNN